jgi:RNase H-fold protein (predicted Holliday junction resolvase)
MKKLLMIVMLIVATLSLISCKKDKCDDDQNQDPEVTYADKWLVGLWLKTDSMDEAITDFESTEYLKIYHDVHDENGTSVSSTIAGKGFTGVHTFVSGNPSSQCEDIRLSATIFTNAKTGRVMDIYSIRKDKNNQYITEMVEAVSVSYGQRLTQKLNEDVMLGPSISYKMEVEINIEVVDTLQSVKVTEFSADNLVIKETEYTEDQATEHLVDEAAAYVIVTEYYKKESNEIYTQRYLYNRDYTDTELHVLKFTNTFGFVNGYFLSLVFDPQE